MNDIMKMYMKAQKIKIENEFEIDKDYLNEVLDQAVKNVLRELEIKEKEKIIKKEPPEFTYRKNVDYGEEEIILDYKSIIIKETYDNINFIDKNDIFVGFDYYRSCCEDFGWYLSNKVNGKANVHKDKLEGYFFDINKESLSYGDDMNILTLKLIHEIKKPIYLNLFNYHNGYYAHDVLIKNKDKKHSGYSL